MAESLGLLAGDQETTAADLMGAYGPCVRACGRQDAGRDGGGILFVDEAYQFANNQFGDESRDQDCVVFDGRGPCARKVDCDSGRVQGENMNEMLTLNQGLAASVPQGVAL